MLWSHQSSLLLRSEESAVVAPEECAVADRQSAVVPSEECCVANREAEPAVLPTEEGAVLRTDSVAAPNRNLDDLVGNRTVFDENWGVLDENLGSAGLPAWPAFRPNIIPK